MRYRWLLAALGLCCGIWALGVSAQTPARNSQVQVGRQFLRSLLRNDYTSAYTRLAPEIRKSVTPARFRVLARPLAARGQRRGTNLELYKLGARLDASGRSGGRLFVAFAWAADSASARRTPPEWLEVTFRDTTSRQILGFSVRTSKTSSKAVRTSARPGR